MTDLASLVVNRRRTQNDRLRYRFTYFPPNISLFPSFTHDPFRKTHRTGTEKDLQTAPFCSTPFSFFSVVLMRAWAWLVLLLIVTCVQLVLLLFIFEMFSLLELMF